MIKKKKVALVTGGAKGIGKTLTESLAKKGFIVYATYCNDKGDFAANSKDNISIVKCDSRKYKSIESLIQTIRSKHGKLDLLINNAGIDFGKTIRDYSISGIENVVNTNLLAPMITTKLSIPLLEKSIRPQIINIASEAGTTLFFEGVGIYGPTKAGLISFTKCCAIELSKYKIRINAICPGFTDTSLNRKFYPKDDFYKEMALKNPLKRNCTPQDVSYVVSFLISKEADFINGEIITVDGGRHLQ